MPQACSRIARTGAQERHTHGVDTHEDPAPASLPPHPADRRQALRETLLAAGATTVALVVAAAGIWLNLSKTINADYRRYLTDLAQSAALLVNPELHRSLNDPSLHNSPAYQQAVEPLRRLRASLPDARYIYTAVRDGDRVRFVLDAATPGDHDGDGIDDQAHLWEVYPDSDPAMIAAFGDGEDVGVASATDRPYSDKWGAFMTGWAPLVDASGRQFGAIGVDVDASLYRAHLQRARFWAILGTLPALALIAICSIAFHRLRLRGLAHAREAAVAARQLALEQQRLRNVIEGTRVGVWEVVVDPVTRADVITVDESWAAMLGRSAAELNPLTPDRFLPMFVHPDDAPAVVAAVDSALGPEDNLFDMDLRMRHADGRWIWTEVRGKVIERDAEGKARRIAGTQMDVTSRKAAELSLQEQQGSFRSLFELSPVGICLIEFPAGLVLKANDAALALLGYRREELLQLTYMDITPEEHHETERTQISLSERNRRFGPFVKELLHKRGHRVRVLTSGVRMRDAEGRDVVWLIMQTLGVH